MTYKTLEQGIVKTVTIPFETNIAIAGILHGCKNATQLVRDDKINNNERKKWELYRKTIHTNMRIIQEQDLTKTQIHQILSSTTGILWQEPYNHRPDIARKIQTKVQEAEKLLSTNGQQKIDLHTYPLEEIAQYTIKQAQIYSKHFGITSNFNFDQTQLLMEQKHILANLQHLDITIENIIKNASDHAYRHTTNKPLDISLTTDKVHKKFQLTFQDYGLGMDPFNAKESIKPGFTTKKYGNGLGMNLVKSYIEALEGEFAISTQLEQGTTITLTQPLRKPIPILHTIPPKKLEHKLQINA